MDKKLTREEGEGGGQRRTWSRQHADDRQQHTHPLMPHPTHRSGLGKRTMLLCTRKMVYWCLMELWWVSMHFKIDECTMASWACVRVSVWGLPG